MCLGMKTNKISFELSFLYISLLKLISMYLISTIGSDADRDLYNKLTSISISTMKESGSSGCNEIFDYVRPTA